MIYRPKFLSLCSLGIAALILGVAPAFAAAVSSLGAASDFAVLSVGTATVTPPPSPDPTAAVTLTRATVSGNVGSAGAVTLTDSNITGNLVSSGARTITPPSTISGTNIQPLPAQVVADFNAAYDALAMRSCGAVLTTLPTTPLSPGVYCFDAALTATGSTLTLAGNSTDTWLFKIGTLGTGALTGTDFTVLMAGGAQACNVTWWVAEAATMTRGAFNGNILAGAAITLAGTVHTAGTPPVETFIGRALAKAGVTLTDLAFVGCEAGSGVSHGGNSRSKCNQGVGNGPENCDPGNSNQDDFGSNPFTGSPRTNDELGGTPGAPGRKGGNK